jgi:hypothetical protein
MGDWEGPVKATGCRLQRDFAVLTLYEAVCPCKFLRTVVYSAVLHSKMVNDIEYQQFELLRKQGRLPLTQGAVHD